MKSLNFADLTNKMCSLKKMFNNFLNHIKYSPSSSFFSNAFKLLQLSKFKKKSYKIQF